MNQKPQQHPTPEQVENFCLGQSKQLIDKALAVQGINWNTTVLAEKEKVYLDFDTAIALDKYRDCIKRGIGK